MSVGFRIGYRTVADAIAALGGFGSDVSVDLPNAALVDVQASRWQTTMVDATPGSETSRITLSVLNGDGSGLAQDAFELEATQLRVVPLGPTSHPAYSFVGHVQDGWTRSAGTGGNGQLILAVKGDPVLLVDWDKGMATGGSGYPYCVGRDFLRGMKQPLNPLSTGGDNVILFSDQNIQLGDDGALTAGVSAVGFVDYPICNGTPAAPTATRAGKMSTYIDTSGGSPVFKGWNGAAWVAI